MVKIRLYKTGAKKKSSYRVVAIDSMLKRNGKTLEIIGYYDPKTNPPTIRVNKARVEHWLSKGAQLSPAVRSLIQP